MLRIFAQPRIGSYFATAPVVDPCRDFAARRCRLQPGLLLPPVASTFPSAYAASASTVPVAGTRAASGISTCSTTSRKKFPVMVAVVNRFPVRSVSRSGLRHRRKFLLVPLPVGAPVALPLRELHRVACRSRSRVAAAAPLKRRRAPSLRSAGVPKRSWCAPSLSLISTPGGVELSHPTHLWCPQRQMRARPALPCHSSAKGRLAAAGKTFPQLPSPGCSVGIREITFQYNGFRKPGTGLAPGWWRRGPRRNAAYCAVTSDWYPRSVLITAGHVARSGCFLQREVAEKESHDFHEPETRGRERW